MKICSFNLVKDFYSFVAPFYSGLAKCVFGGSLAQAKWVFVEISDQKSYLIIGGGDGQDYRGFGKDLKGEYWELSSSMLKRSRSNLKESRLSFHLGDFRDSESENFDEVWLHFVLDTLKDEEFPDFLEAIKGKMNVNGKVVLADFYPPQTVSQKLTQKLMFIFFRLFTRHQRNDLPDYEVFLVKCGFELVIEKKFEKGWVRSQVWQIMDCSGRPSE